MKMLIRPKVKKLTDLDIVKFAVGNESRVGFLMREGFEQGEQDSLISLSFFLRDKIKYFLDVERDDNYFEASVPYILLLCKALFPDNSTGSKFSILTDWLDRKDAKLFLATALYFLKNFDGDIEEKKTYIY